MTCRIAQQIGALSAPMLGDRLVYMCNSASQSLIEQLEASCRVIALGIVKHHS